MEPLEVIFKGPLQDFIEKRNNNQFPELEGITFTKTRLKPCANIRKLKSDAIKEERFKNMNQKPYPSECGSLYQFQIPVSRNNSQICFETWDCMSCKPKCRTVLRICHWRDLCIVKVKVAHNATYRGVVEKTMGLPEWVSQLH